MTVEPVQIWVVPPATATKLERFEPTLTRTERTWAARLRSPDAQANFVVTRAVLRRVLADAVGCLPSDLSIVASARGKPVLANDDGWWFNVSHTTGLALIALHPDVPVGIDVELRQRVIDDEVQRRVCTQWELAELTGHLAPARAERFLRLWVRKEAIAKADGRGLALDFDRLDARRTGTVHVPDDGATALHVRDLDVGPDHLAAVATVGNPAAIQLRRWSDGHGLGDRPPGLHAARPWRREVAR